jgi:capsular polysaccharide biosynthesis protein
MMVEPTEDLEPEDDWMAEGESDWRHYMVTLVSWWREIAVIAVATALLAGLAASALNWLSGPQYKASADVAIVRTVSEITLDPRFTTTSGTDIRYIATNASAWRNALLALAEAPAIAQQVVEQLGDVLDPQERIPDNLARQVQADLVGAGGSSSSSDLMRITATTDSPDKAARIATVWAETYVRMANQIYGQAPDELLASIQAEQVQAESNYKKAQTALEEFIASNRLDDLNRQITEKQDIIDQIAKARAALTATYFDTETGNQTARFERWLQVSRALDQARTLRAQVAAGDATYTGSSALVAELLKLQALTQILDEPPRMLPATESSSTGSLQVQVGTTPLQIQLNADTKLSQNELLADIDGLTQALEQRRVELERQIAASVDQLLSADMYTVLAQTARGGSSLAQSMRARPAVQSDTIGSSTFPTATVSSELLTSTGRDLEEEVRGLRAQLESERARNEQLTQARDLAWETFKTASGKAAELTLARAAASSEVRLAAHAVPPRMPLSGIGTLLAVVLGGLLGLLLGVLIAWVASSLGRPPFLSKRRANV